MPPRLVAARFQLQELLGGGGMSSVYRAIDAQTGRLVVLKIMRDPANAPFKAFQKEWQILGRLKHPNIVEVEDLTELEEDGVRSVFLVMPLLAGATLAELIRQSSARLTIPFVISIISQVCHGLEAAHNQALIHRNVKPSNIFVAEDDSVKLIDFGLASGSGSSAAPFETALPYTSPEQIEEGRITAESDIYSLSVVAYESLTGVSPFKRPTTDATREAIRHYDPGAVSELNPIVTQSVSDAIRKAMAKKPADRYSSARTFGEMLEKGYRKERTERVDTDRARGRLERARKAFERGDGAFASEILSKLEAEGYTDPEVALLRSQITDAEKQKRIAQLLDAAKSRLEENETELALEKLRQVLEMEPANVEAFSLTERVERQRSADQISDLIRIARQHLEANAFAKARETAQQVLAIRHDDRTASELLTEIAVREQAVTAAREQAEQLYESALRLYDRGEISEAYSQLERALAIRSRTPGAIVAEREAVHDALYLKVRTDKNSTDRSYEDALKYLNAKDFGRAVEISNLLLEKQGSNAQFQALRLRIEQARDRELSAYVTEIFQSADSEPDLERRICILEEALRQRPDEVQFQRALGLAREQRDLKYAEAASNARPIPGVAEASLLAESRSHVQRTTEEPQNETGVDDPRPKKKGERNPSALPSGESSKFLFFGAAAALVILVAGLGLSRLFHPQKPIQPPPQPSPVTSKSVAVPLTISPSNAKLIMNGEVRTGSVLTLDRDKTYDLSVSSPGYVGQTRSGLKPNESGWQFQLLPEPLRLEVTSGEHAGRLLLDGQNIWNLHDGDLQGFLVPADAKTHTLSDVNQNVTLFTLEFRATPAAISQVNPIQTTGLAVVTSFGDNAELYGSGGKVLVAGREPQQITGGGIPLDLKGANAEQALAILTDGGQTHKVYIPHGNAPTLSVLLTGNINVGTLVADAAQPGAQLFLDGKERRASRPGHWLIPGLRPGVHDIRAAAPTFPDFISKVTIQKGAEVTQAIEFAAPTSYLVVRDGPPGAEVIVDGRKVAVLDGTGALRQSMPPAPHSIQLLHPGFDSFEVKRTFTVGQSVEIQAHDLIRPFGTLQFAIGPSNAYVVYSREGDGKTYLGSTSGSLKLSAGTYKVVGTAPDYDSQSQTVVVSSAKTVMASFELSKHLVTPPKIDRADVFVRQTDVTKDGDWWVGTGKTVEFKPGTIYTLIFLKPTRPALLLKNKRTRFSVSLSPNAEIVYELDGQNMFRSSNLKLASEQKKSTVRMQDWTNKPAGVRIELRQHEVIVDTVLGEDDFRDPELENDWRKARISLRGDGQPFKVLTGR